MGSSSYLSHNTEFVYNGAVVAIVKPVFHYFELLFFTAVNVQKYFLQKPNLANILKNKSGKTKEF